MAGKEHAHCPGGFQSSIRANNDLGWRENLRPTEESPGALETATSRQDPGFATTPTTAPRSPRQHKTTVLAITSGTVRSQSSGLCCSAGETACPASRPSPCIFFSHSAPPNTATISLQTPLQPTAAVGGHAGLTNGTPGVAVNGHNGIQHTPVPVPTPTPSRIVPPGSLGDPGSLAPPPEGIYRTFEDLLTAVQRVAKDQGYGVVKLRASNYRDGKPTRYDLVCDRGGVKYNSTAKKRNPSTRKVDCPWRAKAVCEVSLANQWRFAVQDSRHNHEARVPAAPPGQENTPLAQSIRSLTNKLDRIGHDMSQGMGRLSAQMDMIEKRLVDIEQRMINMDSRMSGMEQREGEMGVLSDNMAMEGSMLGQAVM